MIWQKKWLCKKKINKNLIQITSRVCATYTCGRRPSCARTCRRAWSSSWAARGCGGRAPGTARRRRRRARAPWWRRRGSPPCRATSSTTACARAPAGSSGRTCSRRAAAATCPSAKARTLLALRQNPTCHHSHPAVGERDTANRMYQWTSDWTYRKHCRMNVRRLTRIHDVSNCSSNFRLDSNVKLLR